MMAGYVCTIAAGIRVSRSILGKAPSSKLVKIDKFLVISLSQFNPWSGPASLKRFFTVLIPFFTCCILRLVATVMKHFGTHRADHVEPPSQVWTFTLWRNCTDFGLVDSRRMPDVQWKVMNWSTPLKNEEWLILRLHERNGEDEKAHSHSQ